jgi:hypothetical protein
LEATTTARKSSPRVVLPVYFFGRRRYSEQPAYHVLRGISHGHFTGLRAIHRFALVDRIASPSAGLIAGALVSAALLLRDIVTSGRATKILEVGTFVLFGGLALYAMFGGAALSVIGVRLLVDSGLLLIVLGSIAVRKPFTLQYAREQVAPELWESPTFIHTNYVITGVWALAFVVMVIAELALLYVPDLPPRAGVIAIVIALVGAVKFTGWYPERVGASDKV